MAAADSSSRAGCQRRSVAACLKCNQRKVRCDVSRIGLPCSNCMHDGKVCEVVPRKKHRPRRTQSTFQTEPQSQLVGEEIEARAHLPSQPTQQGQNGTTARQRVHALLVEQSKSSNRQDDLRVVCSPAVEASRAELPLEPAMVQAGSDETIADLDDNGHGVHNLPSIAQALVPEHDAMDDGSSLSYIGDEQGAGSFVYGLCHPSSLREAGHFLSPPPLISSLKPFEVDYLRQKGAFLLFSEDVCDDLVRCYFNHVHFWLPIVDARSFLHEYVEHGAHSISLLLLWSMFLTAANFVEEDVLRKAEFPSRQAMKSSMYERAKSLYDAGYETDKILLIQATILLGFWYNAKQETGDGAWHWVGIAISISQTLGLHRCPKLTNQSQQLPEDRQRLLRRIWWTCVIRDRWLSLAKGRPMRITREDCDIPMPTTEDVLKELATMSLKVKDRHILPSNTQILAQMWISHVRISVALGSILRVHYSVTGPKPSTQDIEMSAQELQLCVEDDINNCGLSDSLCTHAYQLQLFYDAAVIVLYRPYVHNGPAALPPEAQSQWQQIALNRARAAASNINRHLEKLIDLNAIRFLRPMIITALIPAMQIHLFDSKSHNALTHGVGNNKLQLCMLVLKELRDTYSGADVTYWLFKRAQDILSGASTKSTRLTTPIIKTTATHGLESTSAQPRRNAKELGCEATVIDMDHPNQQQQPYQDLILPSAEFTSPITSGQVQPPLWSDDTSSFSLDQLLSPNFALSEDLYHFFGPSYGGYEKNVANSRLDFEQYFAMPDQGDRAGTEIHISNEEAF